MRRLIGLGVCLLIAGSFGSDRDSSAMFAGEAKHRIAREAAYRGVQCAHP